MTKTGMTIDTQDFDKSFHKLMELIVPEAAEDGLVKAAFELLRDADHEAPQTPTDIKDLKGSRKVDKPKVNRSSISIKAGYTSEYAAYQHEGERKDGTHKVKKYTTTKGATQPGPKFLQSKMVRHKKRYIKIVTDRIKARMITGK